MGVDKVESSRKAKATKNSTDNGVAGRIMAGKSASRSSRRGGFGVEGSGCRDLDVRRLTFYVRK
jgi:hypothetical protein